MTQRTRFLPTLLLVSSPLVQQSDGDYVAQLPDGSKIEGSLSGGRPDGRWRFRFPEGHSEMAGAYQEGTRTGKWRFFHREKGLHAEGKYTKGRPQGEWRLQPRPDGERREIQLDHQRIGAGEGPLLGDVPHGPWTFWWDDGEPLLEGWVREGRLVAVTSFWHRDGTPDPGWIRGEPGDEELPRFLFSDPILPDQLVAAPPVIPRREAPGLRNDLEIRDLQALAKSVDRVVAGPPLEEDIALVRGLGRRALPVLVERLNELDLATAHEPARRIHGLVQVVVGSVDFGWPVEATAPGAVEAMGLAIERIETFVRVRPEGDEFWFLGGIGSSATPQPVSFVPERWLFDGYRAEVDVAPIAESGGAGTEETLEFALDWLALHQSPDGSWGGEGCLEDCPCSGEGVAYHRVGITSLALLALQKGGHSPRSGRHQDEVLAGLRYLLSKQEPESGRIEHGNSLTFLYDHALATRALSLALESTGSQRLREATRRAVDLLLMARNPYGAWRYEVPPNGENDTSVTANVVLALIAARSAGMEISEEALHGASTWFDEVTDQASGRIGYSSPGTPAARARDLNEDFPRDGDEALTAAGLLCKSMLGHPVDELELHGDLLLKSLPRYYDGANEEKSTNFMYYWQYGTYAMHRLGGTYWERWNRTMKETALGSQRKDGHLRGSWDPIGPWGKVGGRVYSTAMMALCLEVYR